MTQAHEKGHYCELGIDGLRDLVGVRVKVTPEGHKRDWDKMVAILAERLNRTDLTPEERVYFEDLLQEMPRIKDVAAHKKLRPVLRELKTKRRL